MTPEHSPGRFLQACRALLEQRISVVEWSSVWSDCHRSLQTLALPPRQETLACLERFAQFSRQGRLGDLDPALGELARLVSRWDHEWWKYHRLGRPWPEAPPSPSPFQVSRQHGRSRITWSCPDCGWELSWQVESPAWEQLSWPFDLECPASCADLRCAENPPSAYAR